MDAECTGLKIRTQEPDCMDLNPGSAPYQLWELKQVVFSFLP